MCGIFGIVSEEAEVSREVLTRALHCLSHRGPDDSGTITLNLTSGRGQIGLAHTRLAILDLSPLGHQPMQDPATGNWIVFNGEIYNFRALQKELEACGTQFKSRSDTEVILAAYGAWGEGCATRLEGMFAFALWDARRQRLLLARDPMGVKPLYYHQSTDAFVFASEVRTLLGSGLVPPKADPTGVMSYLAFGSVYEPWTMVEGIKAVPAGHVLVIEGGSVSSREYWNPLQSVAANEVERRASSDATVAQLPAILRDAVMAHLVSDVPVGVFLSGGIDSSALVAVMSHHGVRANSFSLVFEEVEFNEGQYSRQIARRFGTEHQEITISQHDTLAALPQALCAMDQPTIDGINTYLISAKTRSSGVKVALTGLGADEMFAGYSNFRDVPKLEAFSKGLRRLPKAGKRAISAGVGMFAGKGDRARKLAQLGAAEDAVIHPYFLVRTLFGVAEREALAGASLEKSNHALEDILRESIARTANLDPVNRVSYLESHWYMRNTLLRDSDFMSMAHGLELRVPFLDRKLVEACFGIDGEIKLQGKSPKSLLLASLGVELPREIVNRPKRGFTLPFEKWLRGEMRPVVEDALLKSDWDQTSISAGAVRAVWNRFLAGETSWSRPWSLFVLKHWCEQNL